MTLALLKTSIQAVNLQGFAPLKNEQLEVYQQMAFDWICKLCEPLNLLISYRDTAIYRPVGDGWYLKKPMIAKNDDEYIDIDERLNMAFIYIIVHFIGSNENSMMKRSEASSLILAYSITVSEMGYTKAKQVYEQESFITNVKFDCFGKYYEVCPEFIKTAISCIIECKACMRVEEAKQIEKYKQYLNGVVLPLDREKLVALDSAIFTYLMKNIELISKYSEEQLNSVSTRFIELCKIGTDTVDSDVIALDKRIINDACCTEQDDIKGCIDEY